MKKTILILLTFMSIAVTAQTDCRNTTSLEYDKLKVDNYFYESEYETYLLKRFFGRFSEKAYIQMISIPSWGTESGIRLDLIKNEYILSKCNSKKQLYYSKHRFLIGVSRDKIKIEKEVALELIDLFKIAFSNPSRCDKSVLDGISYYFEMPRLNEKKIVMEAVNPDENSKLELLSDVLYIVFNNAEKNIKKDTSLKLILDLKNRFIKE